MKMSICIPVYKMKDNLGERFLVENLSHLIFQTYKNFEVIISDQSSDKQLKNICDVFSNVLDIKYHTHDGNNAASNVNNCLRHTNGDIVKLLYVDDFFIKNDSIQKIIEAFKNNTGEWLICGFVHCNLDKTQFYDARVPWYGNKYVNGDNTTGNPSTYAVRKNSVIQMDENLLWLVDGEYFYRSYYHYGDPIIVEDILVAFREHTESAFLDPKFRELDTKERKYCEEKYSKPL